MTVSPFAAFCPVSEVSSGSSVSSSPGFAYEPPSWVIFWQEYLVTPFRRNDSNENALITDWMEGEDPVGYATSVVASWLVVTSIMLSWVFCVGCLRPRKKVQVIPDLEEEIGNGSVVVDTDEERHEYPSDMETSHLDLEQEGLHKSMISALSEHGVEEDLQTKRILSLQYLSYCNGANKDPSESESSVDLLGDSSVSTTSSGIISSRTPRKKKSFLEESPMRQQILNVQDDDDVITTFEDVMRNVYLEHDHDVQVSNQQHPVGEISTIVPSLSASFDTTHSIPIMEQDNFLFFHDDDDEEEESHGLHPFSATAAHLPPTSTLTRNANAAASQTSSTTTSTVPPLTMASASSIIRHRKRLLEDYVQSFRDSNTLVPTRQDQHISATPVKLTQTPDTSPTSTLGHGTAGMEGSHCGTAYVFQDENSSTESGNRHAIVERDDRQSNIAVVETTAHNESAAAGGNALHTNHNTATKRVKFTRDTNDNHDQCIQRPRSLEKSRCSDTLPPMMVLTSSTILIVAVILFGMNGVWVLQLQARNVEASWNRLTQHFLEDLPESLGELEELQRSVLQQTWNVWQSLDSNCPKIQGKICIGDLNEPSVEAIDAFWQNKNGTIECRLDGLPLSALWEDWSAVAQPFVVHSLISPQDTILNAQDAATDFWYSLDKSIHDTYKPLWDWTLYVALGANVCLAALAFGIMWMVAVPSSNTRQSQRWLRTPFCWCNGTLFAVLFWILLLLAWAFGMWFSVGTVMTTDTCANSDIPNALASKLMERWALQDQSPFPFQHNLMNTFQDHDCMIAESQHDSSLFQWLRLMEPTVELSTALQTLPPNVYFDICGTALWPLQNSLDRLTDRLCAFTGGWEAEFKGDRDCGNGVSRWYPEFTFIVFDSLCQEGGKALVWVTVTQTLILFMILVVWTFRKAFLPEPVISHICTSNTCCCVFRSFRSSTPSVFQPMLRRGSSQPWYLSKNTSSYSNHGSTGSSSDDMR